MEILCFVSETLAADSLINCQTRSIIFSNTALLKGCYTPTEKFYDDKRRLTLPLSIENNMTMKSHKHGLITGIHDISYNEI